MIPALLIAAATQCAQAPAVYAFLADTHGEHRHFVGNGVPAGFVEVWINDDTGSWTVIATMPDGTSCIRAFGAGFAVETAGELG